MALCAAVLAIVASPAPSAPPFVASTATRIGQYHRIDHFTQTG